MLIKAHQKIKDDYDVIVIGSGLAGMTAANCLARASRKVLLLESHNKLGGLATWFKRSFSQEKSRQHIFDISLHGFPAGMIKTLRRYWSMDLSSRVEQIKEVKFINPLYNLSTDFTKSDYTRLLVSHFKLEQGAVERFFEQLREMNFYDAPQMSTGEFFNQHFPNRADVARFLMEPITYANGSTLDDPIITYGIVFSNFMDKGVFIFKGGTDLMIKMMQDELIKNGVDIQKHCPVKKIIVDERKVIGVETGKDELIKARTVVSNANVITTTKDLVGLDYFSPDFQEKIKKVRPNSSSCQVYIGLKSDYRLPPLGDLIFTSKARDFNAQSAFGMSVDSQTFSVYYRDMRNNQQECLVSSSNALYENWKDLNEDDYQKAKEYLIQRAIEGASELVPGIASHIDWVEASTPKTFKRFTSHPFGTSFGTKFEGLEVSMNLNKELPGLYHCGSVGIIMSGWLGAANYGAIQSHQVDTYLSSLTTNPPYQAEDACNVE